MPCSSRPPALAAGLVVAEKYELVRRLGFGGMGEVWAAEHRTLHEEVAIKLVMRSVGHDDGSSSDGRFRREARIASALARKTRHIVGVTDHGEDGPMAYLVMQLLDGEPLDVRLSHTGPMKLTEAAPIIAQIARGLAVAHEDGVVHRDLKPSNVFVASDEDGAVLLKILDFGIAKLRRKIGFDGVRTTRRGFMLGTPAYMSPEQARGDSNVDHRADVWALAVIAYELLTNALPFEGETPEDLFTRLCNIEPIPIRARNEELPQVVEDFFRRAFAERIGDRFQSALALAGAFAQLERLAASGVSELPRSPPTLDEDIVVKGLPRKRRLAPFVGTAIVAAVVGATAALLAIYFAPEPANPPPPSRVPAPVVVPAPVPEPAQEPEPAPTPAPPRPIAPRRAPVTVATAPAPPPSPSPRDPSEIF
jgi:serine/threonine-protein kinase